jgi:hypothetical protein
MTTALLDVFLGRTRWRQKSRKSRQCFEPASCDFAELGARDIFVPRREKKSVGKLTRRSFQKLKKPVFDNDLLAYKTVDRCNFFKFFFDEKCGENLVFFGLKHC